MLFFLLALSFSVGILILFRLFDKFNIRNLETICVSYLVSAILSLSFSYKQLNTLNTFESYSILASILGVSFFVGFIFLALSTQKSGISITSVASNISVLIPVLVALIFYNEKIQPFKLIGLLLSIPAFYLFFKPQKGIKFKWNILFFPIIIFLITGFNNSILRHAENLGAMNQPMLFLGIIFTLAFCSSIIFAFITKKDKCIKLNEILFGIGLGIANFASTYFFLQCLSIFHSSLFFPIYNLSFIGFSALIGILFFKEKFNTLNYLGLAMAVAAIMLMNL